MNKNSLLAFVLIAFTVIFFNSSLWNNFWYGTILKKPVPTQQTRQHQRPAVNNNDSPAASEQSSGQPGQPPSIQEASNLRATLSDEDIAALARLRDSLAQANPDSADAASADTQPTVQIAEDTITVETDRLIASISTRGARIISLKMKDYRYVDGPRKNELIDLVPLGSSGGAQLSVNNESFDDSFFSIVDSDDVVNKFFALLDAENDAAVSGSDVYTSNVNDNNHRGGNHIVVSDDGFHLFLETKAANGLPLQKVFSFENGTYMVGYGVRGARVAGQRVAFGWECGIDDTEADAVSQSFGGGLDRRRAHYSDGRRVVHFEMKKRGSEEPAGILRWVGMSSKYFFVAVVAEKVFDADLRIEGRDVTARSPDQKKPSKDTDINYSVAYRFEAESDIIANRIYAGPNRIDELSRHELKFEKALFPVLSWARHIFWADLWFPPLAELILKVLQFFYGLVKDYGIAIFLLTLLSKVITYPMTQSSTKSMMRMKDIQPKIVALRNKYKGNPQKMNEEMMALYKAEGINPLNPGCLPMFLQMPIFIALFVVLRKAIELRGARTFILPWVNDLSLPEAMFYLPGAGLPIYGNNVALMPILMAALTFFQQKQTITDPNQKMMIYMMPILMLVMFNGFPAGVVFYWTISSALGLVQQLWLKPKVAAKPAAATVTSGGVTRELRAKKIDGRTRKTQRKIK